MHLLARTSQAAAANTVAPAASAVWSGTHVLAVTKDGNWDGASYSIYAQDGGDAPVSIGPTRALGVPRRPQTDDPWVSGARGCVLS